MLCFTLRSIIAVPQKALIPHFEVSLLCPRRLSFPIAKYHCCAPEGSHSPLRSIIAVPQKALIPQSPLHVTAPRCFIFQMAN